MSFSLKIINNRIVCLMGGAEIQIKAYSIGRQQCSMPLVENVQCTEDGFLIKIIGSDKPIKAEALLKDIDDAQTHSRKNKELMPE